MKLKKLKSVVIERIHYEKSSNKHEGKGKSPRLGIQDLSYQRIKDSGYTIHYQFGKFLYTAFKKKRK